MFKVGLVASAWEEIIWASRKGEHSAHTANQKSFFSSLSSPWSYCWQFSPFLCSTTFILTHIRDVKKPNLLFVQWDLVCDRKSLAKMTATTFFVGVMLGGIVFGYLSDKYVVSMVMEQLTWCKFYRIQLSIRLFLFLCISFPISRYGRKSTLLASYILATVLGFASAFANSYILFSVLRFFTGFSLTGISLISLVLCKLKRISAIKTISKCYNSDLFLLWLPCRCWMGRHASSFVYGCDRQPVLVFRQHAAGCICLPG